jgi:hypothetical protein
MTESAQKILAQAYEREIREQERLRQRLGDGLRRTYEPTVRAPLPSDWLKLLDDLRKRLSPRQ